MKKTRLKPVSVKTKARNDKWADIKAARLKANLDHIGYCVCEWCGGGFSEERLDAHHKDWHRNNCTDENCFIVCRKCHDYIHANNIKGT